MNRVKGNITTTPQTAKGAVRVEAEAAQLAHVRQFVEEIAREAHLDRERMFDLKVAVCEACANALEHACNQSAFLEVCAYLDEERLTFVVTDRGVFRRARASCGPVLRRGLGLPLMVALMDEVVFARTPEGGTQVSLSVALPPAKITPENA